ncbi:hypothetical protein BU15DRAFT_79042 [Melanogaster broomeanus]|nr:hypothetical protein BU15DRAFT_79042 [Melanogaster broomeanus]
MLNEFSFTIEYIPGETNTFADALSRLYSDEPAGVVRARSEYVTCPEADEDDARVGIVKVAAVHPIDTGAPALRVLETALDGQRRRSRRIAANPKSPGEYRTLERNVQRLELFRGRPESFGRGQQASARNNAATLQDQLGGPRGPKRNHGPRNRSKRQQLDRATQETDTETINYVDDVLVVHHDNQVAGDVMPGVEEELPGLEDVDDEPILYNETGEAVPVLAFGSKSLLCKLGGRM